jgi:hypothetical protein
MILIFGKEIKINLTKFHKDSKIKPILIEVILQ